MISRLRGSKATSTGGHGDHFLPTGDATSVNLNIKLSFFFFSYLLLLIYEITRYGIFRVEVGANRGMPSGEVDRWWEDSNAVYYLLDHR